MKRISFIVFMLSDEIKGVKHVKLQQDDMIAQDAMYHDKCVVEMYCTAKTKQLERHCTDSERQLHGRASSEIISFIEENTM